MAKIASELFSSDVTWRHWSRLTLAQAIASSWQYQTVTLTNVVISLAGFYGIYLWDISQQVPLLVACMMGMKSLLLKW